MLVRAASSAGFVIRFVPEVELTVSRRRDDTRSALIERVFTKNVVSVVETH
jgi:hypothetical protein